MSVVYRETVLTDEPVEPSKSAATIITTTRVLNPDSMIPGNSMDVDVSDSRILEKYIAIHPSCSSDSVS